MLLAPGEPVGILVPLVCKTEPLEKRNPFCLGGRDRASEHLAWGERDVVEDGHVGKQVEGLEHDPHLPPNTVDVHPPPGDLLVLQHDPAAVDRLEQVHAPQERRLAGPGRPDEADHLVLADVEVDAAEHLEPAEGLVQVLDAQKAHGAHAAALGELRHEAGRRAGVT